MEHTTFSRILVDIDISAPLPGDVVLMVGDRPWSQPLDFEGLPFRYKRCFSTGHLPSGCSSPQHKGVSTRWMNATTNHLTVHATDSASAGSSHGDDVVLPMTLVAPTDVFVPSSSEAPTSASPILQPSPTVGSAPATVVLSQPVVVDVW